MNQQPDELFRQKLEGFQKPAPATAWEKIAAAQDKKINKGLWLQIAASLLVLALVIYTRWPETTGNEKVSGLVNEATKVNPDLTSLPPGQTDHTKDIEVQTESTRKPKEPGRATRVEKQQMRTVIVPDINSDINKSLTMTMPEIDEVLASKFSETTLAETSYPQTSENIIMVFTAKEVNEYLEKKEIPKATDDTKKSSTWKKLLKKANDLTNNQDPFGELRQKKNEILALNFKNEKQRGQNKQ